jgi:cobalamin biosynthesis Mg chelatase CobN
MSATTSLVKQLLNDQSTSDLGIEADSTGLSRSEIKDAVKEGVHEALAEHQGFDSSESVETSTDEFEADTESQSSGSGLSLTKVLVLGLLLVLLAKKRRSGGTSNTTTQ